MAAVVVVVVVYVVVVVVVLAGVVAKARLRSIRVFQLLHLSSLNNCAELAPRRRHRQQ